MDAQCVADNIKIYRKEKGLSQAQLAAESAVSLATIKNLETGRCPVVSRALLSIAKVLGVSYVDLVRPLQVPDQVYFRCQKKMKEPRLLLHRISKWLKDYDYIEEIQQDRMCYSLSGVTYGDDPETLAGDVRKKLGISESEPILDICGLLAVAGVKLHFLSSYSEGFFGLSLLDGTGKPAIVVNTANSITTERKIFSAAHELGHILMHFREFKAFDLNDRMDKSKEAEADSFASFFLMPRSIFIKKWNESRGYDFYDRLMLVKQYFQVSYRAVMMHLVALGWKDSYKNMSIRVCQTFKNREGRSLAKTIEPSPMRPYIFVEKRFRRLVFDALLHENITTSRAADLMGLPLSEVLEIAKSQSEVL